MTVSIEPFGVRAVIGESLDFSIDVPLDYQPYEPPATGDNPLTDGSTFEAVFKADPEGVEAALYLSTAISGGPARLSAGPWVAPQAKLALAFQASAARLRQVAPGEYQGIVIQSRPRPGPLGPMKTLVAKITLTVTPGA